MMKRLLILFTVLLAAVSASAQSVGDFKWLELSVDSRTIASNGGGTPATLTLTPTSHLVAITCNDSDGCTLTMGEPSVVSGRSRPVVIVNLSANAVTLSDSSGVVELTSGISLGQWESLSLEYVTDRWVERSRATAAGTGAPANADYLVKTSNVSLSAERVVTDTTTVAWDWGTAGQAKANVPDGSISLAKLANLATDSLIGRDTAGTGVPEALTVGGGLEFTGSTGIQRSALTGDVTATAGSNSTTIANDAVTYAKIQNVSAATKLIGRGSASGSGDPEEITLGAGLSMAGTTLSSTVVGTGGGDVVGPGSSTDNCLALFDGVTGKLLKDCSGVGTTTTVLHGNAAGAPTYGAVSLTADVSGDLPYSSLAQGSALSVLGVTGNSTADNASIAAGSDHQVLRRSGTAVAFGAVNIAQAAAITGVLPVANGGSRVAQVVNTQTGAATTGTTQIPTDDTIPQKTEGDEYMTLSITPTSSSNKLKIEVVIFLSSSQQRTMTAALFQDAADDALAAGINRVETPTALTEISFTHYMTAGTTSATTFKVRAGANNTGTTTFNGSSGSRLLGGVLASSITITEIVP